MRRQQGKAAIVLVCLLFALPFGAVGVFASWAIGVTLYDGWRADEWVKVAAQVDGYDAGEIQYRYWVGDREYHGKRLTLSPLRSDESIPEELHSRIAEARAARRPITVFVNPQAPEESVVHRDVHWTEVIFMLPFALGFGGVGVGALYAVYRILRGERARKASTRVASDGGGKLATTWVFTFFWNVIAFPIAIAVLMDAIPDGEWMALLVLLFPIIGVLLLLGAVAGTVSYLRRGGATLEVGAGGARMGAPLQGHIAFPRGVAPGERYRVKLACFSGKDDEGQPRSRWNSQQDAVVVAAPAGARLPFRFQVPPRLKPRDGDEEDGYTWRLEVERADKLMTVPYGFDLAVAPASPSMVPDAALAADDEPMLAAAGAPVDFTKGAFAGAELTREQRKMLVEMTPEQRAQLEKIVALKPVIQKVAIGVFLAILAIMVLPFVIALLLG